MSEFTSNDGRYWIIEQGDGNIVVYDNNGGTRPVWDKWSYEFGLSGTPTPPNPFIDVPPGPVEPETPDPVVYTGKQGTPILIAKGVKDIGMSYWRNINQHRGQNILNVILSRGGVLTVFTIDKRNLNVLNERALGINHTGEGVFFSRKWDNILYYGWENEFYKFNIDNQERHIVWQSGLKIWQVHSNYEENLFSGTLKDGNYQPVAWGLSDGRVFDIQGEPDECQIDKSGEWLLIKENNYNRILNLRDGTSYTIQNEQGAIGHSDIGFGMAFGENDFSSHAGALDCIMFGQGSRLVNFTGIWNMGYFSFTNAKPGDINSQWGLLTTPDELIMVKLDNSMEKHLVCNNLTQSQQYEHRPKANLCPNGEFAIFTSFVDGSLNAYIVRV